MPASKPKRFRQLAGEPLPGRRHHAVEQHDRHPVRDQVGLRPHHRRPSVENPPRPLFRGSDRQEPVAHRLASSTSGFVLPARSKQGTAGAASPLSAAPAAAVPPDGGINGFASSPIPERNDPTPRTPHHDDPDDRLTI
ncbi:hypothetical protein ACFT8P_33440 [Streptomyces sp. NPDC057101]|uniref:hypothetical protein n=1 Tax=Streptomyces sp. NPDC057101 TaxID=3346020 RepID=UPI00362EDBD2